MTEERFLKWSDALSKLLIPVVIAVGGFMYSGHQSKIERKRIETVQQAEQDRRDLERDTGYIKMLASSSESEKKLGLDIIRVLLAQHKFSKDLIPVLTVYAAGPSTNPLTQDANQILAQAKSQNKQVSEQIVSAAAGAPVQVYIQITKEEQRDDAKNLQTDLRQKGFATPQIQLVSGAVATVHTYVRFFSAPGARNANIVNDEMIKLGYSSSVQDFSAYTETPLSSIEIWIGKNQTKLPVKPAA